MLSRLVSSLSRLGSQTISSSPVHSLLRDFNGLESLGFFGPSAAFYNQLDSTVISCLPVADKHGQFSCAVFVLPPLSKMPLHDHPNMHGFIRLIEGSLFVRSYDKASDVATDGGLVMARMTFRQELIAPITTTLSPDSRNIHELVAGNHGCVMLDVLSPDYDEQKGRGCTYFRLAGVGQEGMVVLKPMNDDDGIRGAAWPVWPAP